MQNPLSSSFLYKNVKIKIYRTLILPVVLFGCETWSHTIRKEHGLRVFDNRVLRRIFEPKRNEATEEWKRLHKEELYDLCSSTNVMRLIKARLAWHVALRRNSRRAYRVLVGKPEENIDADGR